MQGDRGTEITSPVGRIVWGHPSKARAKTDQRTRQPVLNKTGQPIMQWSFGVAFDKATFQAAVWPAMYAEAAKGFPNGAPPTFAWKYVDGDSVDREGKPYSQREGYAGCIVLAYTTELQAPGVFKLEGGAYRQLQPDEIKPGDYVRVGTNFKVNIPTDRTNTPSLYVNPLAVELVGYGQEISSGFQADPTALFGGQAAQLPPGASATPLAPAAGVQMPGMGAQPQQPAVQPGMQPQQPSPAAGMPGQLPPPATGFVAAAGQMPGMPPPR